MKYFVSYSHPHGFGSTEINMKRPVSGFDDVVLIGNLISQSTGMTNIVVLNIQALPILPNR